MSRSIPAATSGAPKCAPLPLSGGGFGMKHIFVHYGEYDQGSPPNHPNSILFVPDFRSQMSVPPGRLEGGPAQH